MGHDVKYLGKLTPKVKLSDKEKELFEALKDDDSNYDRLDALEYNGNHFEVNNNEKIYPDQFFESIEKYISKLKEGGNDIKEGSYLVSCSEYGIDFEAIIFLYKNGEFKKKYLLEVIEEYKDYELA